MPNDQALSMRIRHLVEGLAPLTSRGKFNDEDDLFDAGIIDSFGVLQLIQKIEQEFSVRIPNDELIAQNLWSIDAISGLIGRMRTSARVTRE
jgi:acyl carrier protein